MIKFQLPNLMIEFSEVPLNDDFIDNRNELCRKFSSYFAKVIDSDSKLFGVLISVDPKLIVEYTPRSGM